MAGEAAAARITKAIANKGAAQASGQNVRLGTIKSVSPFVLAVDGITTDLTSAELVVNEFLVGYSITGKLTGTAEYTSSGSVSITGSGTVGPASGVVSISGQSEQEHSGSLSMNAAVFVFNVAIKPGDRVAVAPVGNNMWAVLCKVVTVT